LTTPLQYARAFARRDYGILPLYGMVDGICACGDATCRSAGKHPHAGLAPNGLKDATTDADTIIQWFETPHLNYGVVCERIVVVDIDPRNGGDKTWKELKRKRADVHTWEVNTGGGGKHIIFEQLSDTNGGPLHNTKLGRGVDIKGDGGYIVGVGSLHASGKRYKWAPQCAPARDDAPEDTLLRYPLGVPPWIVDLCNGNGAAKHDWKSEATADTPEGERNISDAAFAGVLFRLEVPDQDVFDFLTWRNSRRSNPVTEAEVRRTVKSILKTHLARAAR
jgi:hypothetical protein